ncbi:Protein of unknown function [Roseateles sp. YR242]|uniref:DUF3617 family protein n=1 Tax=Roseateles sp. YR242 TaxID=1855305 RepID=UPI0008BA6CFC|nr:DUF3617 family protein [Roseateles sp. YR242]SEL61124.1 Protein of unknown function [Roseateles sp. YR242]
MKPNFLRAGVAVAAGAALTWGTGAAQAQTVNVKPGLWASSSAGTMNGKKLPTILDINGALTAQQKSALVAGMQQLGLPAGSPSLSCQESGTFELPKPQSTEQCTFQVSPSDSTSGSIQMSCNGQLKGGGLGTYKVTGKTSATLGWKLEGTAQGMPIKMEQTTVYKWVQDDCSQAPKGMDPALVELLLK